MKVKLTQEIAQIGLYQSGVYIRRIYTIGSKTYETIFIKTLNPAYLIVDEYGFLRLKIQLTYNGYDVEGQYVTGPKKLRTEG
jgi:hypothetical protein